MSNTLPTDKELIKEFSKSIYSQVHLQNLAAQIITEYEDFLKQKQESVSKEYEVIERFVYREVPCDGDLSPIKSVKRLSDGVVFKVGDKLANMDSNDTIDAFWTEFNNAPLWVSTNQKKQYGCVLDYANLLHSKPIDYEIIQYGWQENQEDKPDMKVIYKVKRLSDGTVFRLGDNTNKGKIASFTPVDNRIHVNFENGINYCLLSELSHSKVPLLICNWDGVEVFYGDKFFTVDSNYCLHELTADPSISKSFSEKNKTFGTEQAAKEYISLHKKQYSLADLEHFFGGVTHVSKDQFLSQLKNLTNERY